MIYQDRKKYSGENAAKYFVPRKEGIIDFQYAGEFPFAYVENRDACRGAGCIKQCILGMVKIREGYHIAACKAVF